jgi:hypothetical protein
MTLNNSSRRSPKVKAGGQTRPCSDNFSRRIGNALKARPVMTSHGGQRSVAGLLDDMDNLMNKQPQAGRSLRFVATSAKEDVRPNSDCLGAQSTSDCRGTSIRVDPDVT